MKILYSFTVLVFLLVSACGSETNEGSMADVGGKWTCDIEKQFECTRDGCTPRKPRLEIVMDFDSGKYSRCAVPVCESYQFQFSEDPLRAVWVGRIDGARGAYFVADSDGTNFVESTNQGVWTISSFGNCKREMKDGKTESKVNESILKKEK